MAVRAFQIKTTVDLDMDQKRDHKKNKLLLSCHQAKGIDIISENQYHGRIYRLTELWR